MGDFRHGGGGRGFGGGNRGGSFGGGRGGFGGNRGGFGGRGGDRGPVTMHSAVCDECKKPCEVPFRPTGEKPVYCNACFGGKRDEGGGDRRDNRGGARPERSYNDFKAPARNDFAGSPKGGNDDIKKQLEMINIKIDQIFKTVEIIKNGKSVTPAITVVEAKTEKAKEISKKEAPAKVVVSSKENKEKKSAKKVSKKK